MKKYRKHKNLIDALESNAYENQFQSMLENIALLKSDEFSKIKDRLLFLALKNASKDCADFLLSKEAKFNAMDVLRKCDYTKMVQVYELLEGNEQYNHRDSYKKSLINRLIDPEKIDDDKKRLDFLFELIAKGFFTPEEVRKQVELTYDNKPEKKLKFVALYREIKLKELGI